MSYESERGGNMNAPCWLLLMYPLSGKGHLTIGVGPQLTGGNIRAGMKVSSREQRGQDGLCTIGTKGRVLWMTRPTPFSFSFLYSLLCLNPCQTHTSLSLSSPFSSDLLNDSFYESFLYLSYDSFGLITWVIPMFIPMTHTTDSDSWYL